MSDVRRLPVGEDNEARVTLDDLAGGGPRRMIAAALEAEVDEYVCSLVEEVGEDGEAVGGPQRSCPGATRHGWVRDRADSGAAGRRQARG
jgi:hypothetical protein